MSNVTDGERLMVLVEARITDLEKNMAKASATTGRQYGRMRRDSRSATAGMEQDMRRSATRINQSTTSIAGSIGSMSKAFATGLAGGLIAGGAVGIVTQMREIAEDVANIGSEAQRAGVSAKAFQELGYVATQNRIPIDALTDGLKELSLRADELIQTGTGPAAESFHRLGFTAEELKEKLKNPSELLVEIIGRMERLDKASQIRISDELFGGSAGERFVELLDDGADGVRRLIKEANDLGVVIDDEVIAKAAEVDRQFKIITNTVGTSLRAAIVNAASALSGFIDQFRAFENQSARTRANTLKGALSDVASERKAAQAEIDALRATDNDPMLPDVMRGMNERTLIPQQEARLREARAREAQILRQIDAESMKGVSLTRPAAPVSTLNPEPFNPPKEPSGGGRGGGGGASRSGGAGSARAERDAVAELIAELEEERTLISATDVERQIANALRSAGADATDEQKQKISDLITQIEAETVATEGLQAAQEKLADIGRDVLSGIVDGLRQGASAGEILGNVIDDLASKLIDMAIQNLVANAFPAPGASGGGGGLLTGLLSLFGGARASGGQVTGGKLYPIGEQGPELFAPGQSGMVIANHSIAALSAPVLGGGPAARAPQVVDIRLTDDTGRMANIARKEINTASGDIIRVSVQESGRQGKMQLPAHQADTQRRTG